MTKTLYIAVVVLYLLIISIWCFRFPISYRMTTGIDPNLILLSRDLTDVERRDIEEAYQIRATVSAVLLYSSLALSIGSFILIRTSSIKPKPIVKPIMIISALIALVLLLVNGIHFIPGPPIR